MKLTWKQRRLFTQDAISLAFDVGEISEVCNHLINLMASDEPQTLEFVEHELNTIEHLLNQTRVVSLSDARDLVDSIRGGEA